MYHLFRISTVSLILVLFSFTIGESELISFEKKYTLIDLDVLGNPLLVNAHGLDKYNSNGKLLSHYSELSNGDIHDIDASDALHLLVYYHDFQKLLFLDSDLSPKLEAIDLSELDYSDAKLVCSSFGSGFWIWDEQSAQMLRFNNNLQVDQKTGNVHALIGKKIKPIKIREGNQYLVALDKAQGFFIFDRYGAYLKQLAFDNVKDFQFRKGEICYLQNDMIRFYNVSLHRHRDYTLANGEYSSFSLRGGQLLLKDTANQVTITSFRDK